MPSNIVVDDRDLEDFATALVRTCAWCDGHGHFAPDGGWKDEACPFCNGTGQHVIVVADEESEAA